MLPFISEETRVVVTNDALQDVTSWNKKMIHIIKESNPEINSAIIEAANNTDFDPKAVALGAYMTYAMLEKAEEAENSEIDQLIG